MEIEIQVIDGPLPRIASLDKPAPFSGPAPCYPVTS